MTMTETYFSSIYDQKGLFFFFKGEYSACRNWKSINQIYVQEFLRHSYIFAYTFQLESEHEYLWLGLKKKIKKAFSYNTWNHY